jgi:hypothetical protein
MSDTLPTRSTLPLEDALETLVSRGTISPDQRAAILAEVGGRMPTAAVDLPAAGARAPATAPTRHRRSLSEVLIEVGLYVGGTLVIAAAVVLVAQNWGSMSLGVQIASFGVTALVAGGVALVVAHGAGPGSARRRLAGVLFVGAAISAAGTTALLVGEDTDFTGIAAFTVALAVMVGAHLVASSTITELGMFVATFGLVQTTVEAFRPEAVSDFYDEVTTYDRYSPLALVLFGGLWALVVSRRLVHRELAVLAGMVVALMGALPIIGENSTRTVGMVVMALLAGLGFWRFLVEGYWPWLAAAIASVTALVFWAVGGADRPALAILVAGLVMLGSSAMGMLVARRRRAALTAGDVSPPVA